LIHSNNSLEWLIDAGALLIETGYWGGFLSPASLKVVEDTIGPYVVISELGWSNTNTEKMFSIRPKPNHRKANKKNISLLMTLLSL
jgi:hypothetical protein